MAIYPTNGASNKANMPSTRTNRPIDIEAWTEQATEALLTSPVSPTTTSRRATVTLSIPLDGAATRGEAMKSAYVVDPVPARRDSMKRREALLKGKEGTRRRQRWENDRLLSNPWVQPPLPSDWEVHPTHPKHVVPYFLAPLWDAEMAARRDAEQKKRRVRKTSEDEVVAGRVPKELREKLKRSKAAKGLLRDLEEEVRKFVKSWEEKEKERESEGLHDVDSDEDEIVFVGKNGRMHDMPPSPKAKRNVDAEEEEYDMPPSPKPKRNLAMEEEVRKEKLMFDSLADDHGASFRRWLVHSIASYYGLRTWSVTVGNPARRAAYVGIEQMKAGHRSIPQSRELPRPLYGLV